MKIALYGKKMEPLLMYKKRMERDYAKNGRTMEIDCFSNRNVIKERLFNYDIVILSDTILKEADFKNNQRHSQEITLISKKQIETINIDEVFYIEADSKNIHIWKDERECIIKFRISEMEKLLEEAGFVKTHRSYLVNMRYIRSVLAKEVILKNGKSIPVSKYRMKEVTRQYLNWIKDDS